MAKAVVLLSGGLDSATAYYLAMKNNFDCLCLIFDYNQRHRKEIEQAKKIARYRGSPYKVIKLNLPLVTSSLTNKKLAIKNNRQPVPQTYVPARNTVFLSIALSIAEDIGAKAIFIGANTVDFSGYPDCRKPYFQAFRRLARLGTKSKATQIRTPLINLTKAQIIKLGNKLGVPYELTWSCYRGGKLPCGVCDSCFYRAKGFREAGIEDPLCRQK